MTGSTGNARIAIPALTSLRFFAAAYGIFWVLLLLAAFLAQVAVERPCRTVIVRWYDRFRSKQETVPVR